MCVCVYREENRQTEGQTARNRETGVITRKMAK